MKITVNQLRKIIAEEVTLISEAADLGAALSAGSLAGVGKASIIAALSALSDADFKKLELAMRDAGFAKSEKKQSAKVSGMAASFSPASLAKKINASLSNYNWSWAGQLDTDTRDAIYAVLDSTLGEGTSEEFDEALYYYDADVTKSDVFRKMSRADAKSIQRSSMKTLQRIANDLAGS